MHLEITAIVERFPVAGQFVIARGAKTYVDVLVVAVSDGTHIGMGESTAIYYHGETAEKCLGHVMRVAETLQSLDVFAAKDMAQILLPAGAARNALDCALWDLASKAAGVPLWQLAGLKSLPVPLVTAFTISLGEAAMMQESAAKAAAAGYSLLKLKLTGNGDCARVAAVRSGAPDVRLIVDANESWDNMDIAEEAAALAALGVEMIEQPVKVGNDAILLKYRNPQLAEPKATVGRRCLSSGNPAASSGLRSGIAVPIIADESCQSLTDIEMCARYYDGINIKLDKAGGLTEALAMARAAETYGLTVMTGCMLSTSLGIAPAFLAAQGARWADLDGPALLAQDREGGFRFKGGMISVGAVT